MNDLQPLHAAVLTPHGRGAVAVIHVRGPLEVLDAHFFPNTKVSAAEQPLQAIRYGLWGTEASEDVVFIRIAEDEAEIHCHGGTAAVQRILNDLKQSDAELTTWELLEANQSPLEQDFDKALLKATTRRSALILLWLKQEFPLALEQLKERSAQKRKVTIEQMLSWSDYGCHLIEPWKVVLFGRPNVGKSSLINALIGYERSIVFDQSGTTRDVVKEQTALNGWPVEFADTAGMHDDAGELESQGIQNAKQTVSDADLRLIVLSAVEGITPEDQQLVDEFPNAMIVWNKCDLVENASSLDGLAVSAVTKLGIEEFTNEIIQRLVPVRPPADLVYPVTQFQRELLLNM